MQSSVSAGNETAFNCDNSPTSNPPLPVPASADDSSSKFNAFLSSSNKLFNNLLKFTMLDLDSNSTCSNNCSGHGECLNSVCFCEVEFTGQSCSNPNLNYYIAFSTIFFVLCAISFVQLVSRRSKELPPFYLFSSCTYANHLSSPRSRSYV